MAEIVDPSKDFSSSYHISSHQHMICSLYTQQECRNRDHDGAIKNIFKNI